MVWVRHVASSLLIVCMTLGAWSCGPASEEEECTSGSEGCPCMPEGDCHDGLACVSGVCENLCPIPYRCSDEKKEVRGDLMPYLIEECNPATGEFEAHYDCSAESPSDGGCACDHLALGAGPSDEVHCHIACAWDGAICNGLDGIQYEVPCE